MVAHLRFVISLSEASVSSALSPVNENKSDCREHFGGKREICAIRKISLTKIQEMLNPV